MLLRPAEWLLFKRSGFPTDTGCTEAHDPDGTKLTVHWPPTMNAGTFAGDLGKVEVQIGRQHVTFVARVLGIGQIGVASSAVAANDDGNSNSSSLIALDPGGCSGNPAGFITGGGRVEIVPAAPGIEGGYVHVNSSCGSNTGNDICTSGPVPSRSKAACLTPRRRTWRAHVKAIDDTLLQLH